MGLASINGPDLTYAPERTDTTGNDCGKRRNQGDVSLMSRVGLIEEALTESVIRSFYEVYNQLGFGFLESVYSKALEVEWRARNHCVVREVPVPVLYKDIALGGFRVDTLVDDKLIIEVKSSQVLPITAKRQLYNYLKATNLEVGLLLHFGTEPKFYREICMRSMPPLIRSIPAHPPNPAR